MPELPEVETVKNGLAPFMDGATIKRIVLNRPNLRFPFPDGFQELLEGQQIGQLRRRAKYLIVPLMSGTNMLAHLGMSGSFKINAELIEGTARKFVPLAQQKHDHVILEVVHPTRGRVDIIYNDPRRFGYMDLFDDEQESPHFAKMGPEPLGNQFNAQHLAERFLNKKTPIKSALLDQRNVAGLGNIYVCEALFLSKIDPRCPIGTLVRADGKPKKALELLAPTIVQVLNEAIAAGGSTLKDFKHADGELGYFQHRFQAYGREGEPCLAPNCKANIARIVQSGRSTFYCPNCQT
ncbi:bifunctional DNA-formamidopyrimidine glycosylase/DNA-(apurinic or apyrimidinic site) lyase [Maritalea porphyrae]|uniref:bifunctional DNA-formamidopyrimidine glycosylase/DNA-(apurinic or apyrimidinic site) lyase n=1 Tax=Maritalea porphyrae TaxID=880732 RepID=UPI0022AEE0A4|nr:bifunctional DNA-formamidopyrimidine glycosylase/DNA-(apurinic or apyrimidinic site) lyase [Maritalea porphyrae]MCZ4272157.1 bifunctional DNA-formamidopyrimidine glycosylase/DNA-(apurinic or apyrimidinic site) lyase [Maritalea porphyrae]